MNVRRRESEWRAGAGLGRVAGSTPSLEAGNGDSRLDLTQILLSTVPWVGVQQVTERAEPWQTGPGSQAPELGAAPARSVQALGEELGPPSALPAQDTHRTAPGGAGGQEDRERHS